jgi:hypothetical protein
MARKKKKTNIIPDFSIPEIIEDIQKASLEVVVIPPTKSEVLPYIEVAATVSAPIVDVLSDSKPPTEANVSSVLVDLFDPMTCTPDELAAHKQAYMDGPN